MSVKRSCCASGSVATKKRRTPSKDDNLVNFKDIANGAEVFDDGKIISDTKAAILYLRSLFPVNVFEGRVPPIILKHQIYNIVSDRTTVDRELNDLWEQNEVCLFQMVHGSDEFLVVLAIDFYSHAKQKITNSNRGAVEKFLGEVVSACHDVSISKNVLTTTYKLTDEEITVLMNAGLLTSRDVGSYWFEIPGGGTFMKHFTKGRKAVVRVLKKCKFKEILQNDLEQRKVKSCSQLGIKYHIHDILGADIVKGIPTTSGPLLRLNEHKKFRNRK